MEKLCVIGNGFDLHHKYNSKYVDFWRYLKRHNREFLNTLERYIASDDYIKDNTIFDYQSKMHECDTDPDLMKEYMESYFDENYLWKDFENALSKINVSLISEDNSSDLVSYGADDWSDSYHHDFENSVDESLNSLTKELKKEFKNWICTLKPGVVNRDPDEYNDDYEYGDFEDEVVNLVPNLNIMNQFGNAHFINFNYTNSLEDLYDVGKNKITYIHGEAAGTDDLIVGHGQSEEEFRNQYKRDYQEDEGEYYDEGYFDDPRQSNAFEDIVSAYNTNSKPTEKIIAKYSDLFSNMSDTKEIYILGHSLSKVDHPYFKEIIKSIDIDTTKWIVSYYNESSIESALEVMTSFGIHKANIEFKRMENL